MTHFDDSELIDCLRHSLQVDDDTGLCQRVLFPIVKRGKFGGLPLNFRSSPTESDEEHDSPGFAFPHPMPPDEPSTRALLADRLRAKSVGAESAATHVEVVEKCTDEDIDDLFKPLPASPTRSDRSPAQSVLSLAILNASLEEDALAEFARFEGRDGQPARQLRVFVPDEIDDDDRILVLNLLVMTTAKVHQVIGLCCWKIAKLKPDSDPRNPAEHQFLLAEDSGEVDTDFPALDASRSIADTGFSCLALLKKTLQHEERRVVVHTATGQELVFEIESLDACTVQWLRDEAIKRKVQLMDEDERARFKILNEYVLEHADPVMAAACPEGLPLHQSLANCGTLEFLLRRKNSSRPDEFSDMVASLSGGPLSPAPPTGIDRQISTFSFNDSFFREFEIIVWYRAQRFLPVISSRNSMWSVCIGSAPTGLPSFSLRMELVAELSRESLDVVPRSRRSALSTPVSYRKATHVPWSNLAEVALVEDKKKKLGKWSLSHQGKVFDVFGTRERGQKTIRITWLTQPENLPDAQLEDLAEGSVEEALRFVIHKYDQMVWKYVQLDTIADDAPLIMEKMQLLSSPRDARDMTVVRLVWLHSQNGSRRPVDAADAALCGIAASPMPPTQHHNNTKRRSRIMNPLPAISRMLSVRDSED